jgi:hypothetical protein
MEKFQNVNFEKPVVLKVAQKYKKQNIVLQLFQFSSTWRIQGRTGASAAIRFIKATEKLRKKPLILYKSLLICRKTSHF